MKNTNFFERIEQIANHYGYNSVNEFALKGLEYKSSEKLNRLRDANKNPSVEIIKDISNKFEDVDLNWLINDVGNMIIDKTKSKENLTQMKGKEKGKEKGNYPNVEITLPSLIEESSYTYRNRTPSIVTVDSLNNDNIVLVPQKLQAGYLQGYDNPSFINKLPTFRMPGLNNGVFRMFEVEGNSMFPTLSAKSFVVGQFVENWITGIKDNNVYAIISNELEDGLVKRCINKIKKYNNLICKSDNRRNFPTQNINPESIKEIWEIKLHLNFQLPDPADIYDKLYDLEGEVSSLKELVKRANLV